MIRVNHLSKHYGPIRALDDCSIDIPEATVFGLLGPNGAGKTTLIRILMGFLRPTAGECFVRSWDCARQSLEVRKNISYLPAEAQLFRSMRGKDVIDFFSGIHPHGDRTAALQLAQRLELDISRRVAFMSTGMRQKLAIACAASCRAPILVLDEPTANLDPSVRFEVMRLVSEVHSEGRTVLLCSHVLSEIEEVCQFAAILRKGKIVHQVDIPRMRAIHRLSGQLADGRPSLTESELPAGVRLCQSTGPHLVCDIHGPIEHSFAWISSLQLSSIRIEPVGLRSIYEEFHSPALKPSAS